MSLVLEDYFASLNEQDDPWLSAGCRDQDPEMWWEFDNFTTPEPYGVRRIHTALTACEGCPVVNQCLKIGCEDDNIQWGIWGGMFPGERLQLVGKTKYFHEKQKIEKAKKLRRIVQRYALKKQEEKKWSAN